MNEQWLPIVGYEGIYDISNLARVRRMKRCQGGTPGRILKPGLGKNGYLTVALNKDDIPKTFYIHALVYRAFYGELPSGCEINHKDGCKTNNESNNLEAMTRSENVRHAHRMGLIKPARGENAGRAKMSDDDVREILRGQRHRKYVSEIANKYGVHTTTIRAILERKTWKHI